jgi:hypothetical protein
MQLNAREAHFHKKFIEKPDKYLRGCGLIKSEKKLFGAYNILDRDVRNKFLYNTKDLIEKKKIPQIARIDLLILWRSRYYAVEIKYTPFTISDFWDALKIIGYTEYLNWQEEPVKKFAPAIMMPKNKIKLENQIVANKLNITLFGIEYINNDYEITQIDDNYRAR